MIKPKSALNIQDKYSVPIETLDAYCRDRKIGRIDILKIDTQGFEDECLAGAAELLQEGRIGMIKLEIMLHETYDKRTTFHAIEHFLLPHGYLLYDISWIKKSSYEKRTLVLDVIYIHSSYLDAK